MRPLFLLVYFVHNHSEVTNQFTVKNHIFVQSSTCSSRMSNSDRVQSRKIHFKTIQLKFSFFAMLLVHNT